MKKDKKIETEEQRLEKKYRKTDFGAGTSSSVQPGIDFDPTNQGELNKAKARFLNKLCDLMEEWPESRVAEALADKMMKDIQT